MSIVDAPNSSVLPRSAGDVTRDPGECTNGRRPRRGVGFEGGKGTHGHENTLLARSSRDRHPARHLVRVLVARSLRAAAYACAQTSRALQAHADRVALASPDRPNPVDNVRSQHVGDARRFRSSAEPSTADEAVSSASGAEAQEVAREFGAWLRAARERQGSTLQQISRETKIPTYHLEALEGGNFAALPGTTYCRGEVVAYAASVSIERTVALERLRRALAPAEQASNAAVVQAQQLERGLRHLRMPAGGSVAMVAGAGVCVALTLTVPVALSLRPTSNTAEASGVTPRTPSAEPVIPAAPVVVVEPAPPIEDRRAALPAHATQIADPRGSDATRAPVAGKLVVTTIPSGARVTVNGIGWGATPVAIDNLPPGRKRIRVTRDGYSPAERALELPATGGAKVTISLRTLDAPDAPGPNPRHHDEIRSRVRPVP